MRTTSYSVYRHLLSTYWVYLLLMLKNRWSRSRSSVSGAQSELSMPYMNISVYLIFYTVISLSILMWDIFTIVIQILVITVEIVTNLGIKIWVALTFAFLTFYFPSFTIWTFLNCTYFLCMWMLCLHAWVPWRLEEGVGFPERVVIGGCESSWWALGIKPRSSERSAGASLLGISSVLVLGYFKC